MTEPETRPPADHAASATEQRRDLRFDVVLAAQLVHRDGALDCTIRDFCLGGLFVRFAQADAAIATLGKFDDSAVEIAFSVNDADGNAARFQIAARLKRLTPVGVGLAFAKPPVDALRALQKLRLATQRQRLAAMPTLPGQNPLRETCVALLQETLLQTCGLLPRQLDDDLAQAAFNADSLVLHSSLLNAQAVFRQHAATTQRSFVDAVLLRMRNGQSSAFAAKPALDPASLSLVDKLEFEDWLDTAAEITRLENQFSVELAEIEPRIAQLFESGFDHNSNPLGPSVLCHAYRAAIEPLAVLPLARSVAYGALRVVLSEQLAALYAELLALLPVSEVELARRIVRQQTRHSARAHQDTQTENAPGWFGSDAPQTPRSALSRIGNSLLDYFRPPAATGDARAGSQQAAQSGPFAAPAQALPSQVLQRLAAASALPQDLDQDMQRSVEMFGALFDSMHAEKSISSSMRPFFGQLEASLVKLAIADPAFLASPNHPAHKVLNTLDRISMVAGDDGKISDERLLRLMTRWTDRINAEAGKNPGVFDEARTQLERVVKPLLGERSARIARLQEICEGRQRAETGKQRVLAELLARLGARPVPHIVIDLINNGWRSVLLRSALRHGEDGADTLAAWQVLEQLGDWLAPDAAANPGASERARLLQHVDTALAEVCADKFAQDRLLDQLATVLFDHDRAHYEYTTVAAKLRETPEPALTPGQNTLVEKLRVGDWLQFAQFDAPLNLVWIGDAPPVYVFATYRGVKKLDLKRADLLKTLELGETRWTEDLELPLMDRSYSAMIQKMQRDLIWQSSHDAATGLINRRAFFRAMRRHWLRDKDNTAGYATALIQIGATDADGAPPDAARWPQLMHAFSARLAERLGPDTLQARAGEHAIAWWQPAADAESAQRDATALQREFANFKLAIDAHDYTLQTPIGIAWHPDCLDPVRHYDNANAAATAAREAGPDAVVVYQSDAIVAASGVVELAQWAHLLARILDDRALELDYRTLDDSATATTLYHEIVPRFTAPDAPALPDLLHMAERLQRIAEIDRSVLSAVFAWMRAYPERLPPVAGLAVKLSAQALANPVFLRYLLTELERGDLPGDKLVFEISEAAAEEGHSQTQHFVRQLQRHGCRFVLGEFGTGASSFTALKSLKLYALKIDPVLLRDLGNSMIDAALVRSIVETANFLGVRALAAHVGDAETQQRLRELGVHCVQGETPAAAIPLDDL